MPTGTTVLHMVSYRVPWCYRVMASTLYCLTHGTKAYPIPTMA